MDSSGRTPAGLPARLGRYVVRRRIGSGGFATVWLAYDEQLDSPVAVKVLGDIWTEDHQIRRRFVEEGRYLRKVESPYVVSVYDAGELDDGRPYLVMSYADQGTLADRLDGAGLTPAQSMQVVREIGAGLQALHDRGVLHRDVKPANVLFRTVDASGPVPRVRAMLGDLGLGKSLDVSSRLTMVAGTPSFVAPEQAAAESPGPPADQYSLAALTFLLLTGRRPFERTSLHDATLPLARGPVSTPERTFPDAVERVLDRGLAHAPADRYPSVTAFVTALESALAAALADGDLTTTLPVDADLTRPGPRPSLPSGAASEPTRDDAKEQVAGTRRRRRSGLLVGVSVGLVALALGGWAGYAAQQSRHPDVTVDSDSGTLSVTVPDTWSRARSTDGWRPPNAEQDYDVISVGTSSTWTSSGSSQQGIFLGLLPGRALPPQVPQHPECTAAGPPSHSGSSDDASVTVVYSGCPGGVVVERVKRVTNDELLWIQVRSRTQATAAGVLDTVATHGI